ncbi:hypothetical protein [Sporolactobacillus nakayamae]|uniref:hypothetical protein n=1 Tax=Sporolactobacillus nakayamae TaxID=269670 RepID=UPI0015A68EC7|nr:hypothetical protein [Sporolactobacillus nakayamae]
MDYKELSQLRIDTEAVILEKNKEIAKTVTFLCRELRIANIEKITPQMVAAIAELSKQN